MRPGKRILISSVLVMVLVGIGFGNTQPASGAAAVQTGDPVFVGAGDITNCRREEDDATATLLDAIPGTVFTVGDTAYPDGTPEQYAKCYEPTWGRHKSRTRPVVGNHEYHTPGAAGYFTYFGAAASPLDSNCTSDCKGYYSYDLGAWHIIALNTEIEVSAGSPQELWLRADLEANPGACTLAYFHSPRFNSGRHGNVERVGPLWEALYDHQADVVLNGHDHNYQRFAPQNPNGQADPKGIREFVVGMGGAGLYRFVSNQPNTEVRNDNTYGVLKLTLHATSYDWEFIPIPGGTFTDFGTADCVGDGIPTRTPTGTSGPGTEVVPSTATVTGETGPVITPTVPPVVPPVEPDPSWFVRFIAWLTGLFRRG